jgi:hypothetical protein
MKKQISPIGGNVAITALREDSNRSLPSRLWYG